MSDGCWSCGEISKSVMACKACGHIQAYKPLDHFTLFELPESFDVDLEDLANRHRSLQSLVHPDRLGTQSSREKLYGGQWSQTLNQAHGVLKNPMERALYIISKALGDELNLRERTVHDPELLTEMYEVQEKIEGDLDQRSLNEMIENFKNRLKLMERNLSKSIEGKEWNLAILHLNTYQYLLKIINLLNAKQPIERSA